MSASILRLSAVMAAAGAARLGDDLGEAVTAGDPTQVELTAAVPGDAVAARSPLSGAATGDLLTVVSAADLGGTGDEAPALHLADPLLASAAAALTGHAGGPVTVGPAASIPDFDPATVAGDAVAVSFDLVVGEAAPMAVLWVFPASVANRAEPAAAPGPPAAPEAPEVAAASFPELGLGAAPNGMRDLSVLADIAMDVTVELGRARLKVRELLSLQKGSIVELDRAAGAAVDVLVNGTVVAHGDVVVIDDDLGVRITAVVEGS